MASITIQVPDQEPLEITLDGYEQLSLGRGPDNDIVLDHESMSGSHAIIRNNGGAYQVVDLSSTNGTFLDGEEVTEAALGHGSQLMFGNVQAVFVDESAADASDGESAASGSGYGSPSATLAEVSATPEGFTDLSPIEKVEKKDVVGQAALIAGFVALVAAIALIGITFTMSAG